MYILALDASSTMLGFAISGGQTVTTCGEYPLCANAGIGLRLATLARHVKDLLEKRKYDLVLLEQPCGGRATWASLISVVGACGIVLAECAKAGVEVRLVSPTSWQAAFMPMKERPEEYKTAKGKKKSDILKGLVRDKILGAYPHLASLCDSFDGSDASAMLHVYLTKGYGVR